MPLPLRPARPSELRALATALRSAREQRDRYVSNSGPWHAWFDCVDPSPRHGLTLSLTNDQQAARKRAATLVVTVLARGRILM